MARNVRLTQVLKPLVLMLPVVARPLMSTAGTAVTPEPMTRARTEEVLREYIAELLANGSFAGYLDDAIEMTLVDLGQVITGREATEQAIINFHQVAFAASPEIRNITFGPGVAHAELVFVGTHTGEFAGIPATGRQVSVPYVAAYDLAGDKITALRLYGPASGLVQQITADSGS